MFSPAKDAFQSQPHKTIEVLERLADCVTDEDLVANFLPKLGDPDTFECWVFTQNRFSDYLAESEVDPSDVADISSSPRSEADQDFESLSRTEQLEKLTLVVQDRMAVDPEGPAIKQVKHFIEREQERHQERLKSIRYTCRTGRKGLAEALSQIVLEASQISPTGAALVVQYFYFSSLLIRPSSDFGEELGSEAKLSLMYRDGLSVKGNLFTRNLIDFATMITGCDNKDIKTRDVAMQKLRNAADDRKEQWGIFYDTIERLQSTIDKQKQIITSLEYRHALENLPNKDSAAFQRANKDRHHVQKPNAFGGASGAWHTTWEIACLAEITKMVQLATTVPPTTSDRPLELLLRYDFNNYWKKETQKQKNLQIVTQNLLNQGYFKGPYEKWPSYEHGKNMYGVLSGNIHGHGSTYEVDSRNWPRIYNTFFQWLEPTVDGDGDVNWEDEWTTQKTLPT